MLTEKELTKVFSWQPYRDDWLIDRNQRDDNITLYYGNLIKALTQNLSFETHYSEDGGLGNYLEFMCYPAGYKIYEGNAILVCVSLCSPIAAYGQITVSKGINFFGWQGIFSPDATGIINDKSLMEIEIEIKSILASQNLAILDKDFASRSLPMQVEQELKNENHNEGNQYLHGIFQKVD